MHSIIASSEATWAAVAAIAAAVSAALTAGIVYVQWRATQRAQVVVYTDKWRKQDDRTEYELVIKNLGPAIARKVRVSIRQRDESDHSLPRIFGGHDDRVENGHLIVEVGTLAPGQELTKGVGITFGTKSARITGDYSWQDTGKHSDAIDTSLPL